MSESQPNKEKYIARSLDEFRLSELSPDQIRVLGRIIWEACSDEPTDREESQGQRREREALDQLRDAFGGSLDVWATAHPQRALPLFIRALRGHDADRDMMLVSLAGGVFNEYPDVVIRGIVDLHCDDEQWDYAGALEGELMTLMTPEQRAWVKERRDPDPGHPYQG